jgi:hypothetical protein
LDTWTKATFINKIFVSFSMNKPLPLPQPERQPPSTKYTTTDVEDRVSYVDVALCDRTHDCRVYVRSAEAQNPDLEELSDLTTHTFKGVAVNTLNDRVEEALLSDHGSPPIPCGFTLSQGIFLYFYPPENKLSIDDTIIGLNKNL